MRKKSLLFIVFLSTLLLAANFQRFDREKRTLEHISQSRIELKALNQGLPFTSKGSQYSSNHVLVKFKPTLREENIEITIAAYGAKKIRKIPVLDVYKIQISEASTVEETLYALSRNPDVEYAEPDYIASIALTPNDPLFSYQYSLSNSGQQIGSLPGSPKGKESADIKATAGWEETTGKENVIIAIIDTGVDLLHPDLKNKIQSSGRDLVNNDFDATDDHGHGTHVAGIAAADTNNGEGVAGVAWKCKILPVKVMDKEGTGFYSWVIEATIWAVDNGAQVVNLSLGGDEPAQSLRDAVKYAFEKGAVVVAAAGNDGGAVLYPAAYDAYCLAVAATDYNDLRTSWSNFGSSVDIAAPGERVAGCVPTWYWGPNSFPYAFSSGTSMSTAHASGLAALIKSIKPWLTAGEIMDVIRYSADDINASQHKGKDEFIGYGRINMEKALVPIKIKK